MICTLTILFRWLISLQRFDNSVVEEEYINGW